MDSPGIRLFGFQTNNTYRIIPTTTTTAIVIPTISSTYPSLAPNADIAENAPFISLGIAPNGPTISCATPPNEFSITDPVLLMLEPIVSNAFIVSLCVADRTDVKNNTQGIINTLGAKIADTDAVLSNMFTAIKTIPSQVDKGLTSVLSATHNDTMNALDTIGSSISKTGSVIENSFGGVAHNIVGSLGTIPKDMKGAFSAISAFGAKLGYVLEIVGITIAVVVVVGIILYVLFVWRPKSLIPGESKI